MKGHIINTQKLYTKCMYNTQYVYDKSLNIREMLALQRIDVCNSLNLKMCKCNIAKLTEMETRNWRRQQKD